MNANPPSEDWTLRQAQEQVDNWINSIGVRYFSPLTNLAQLMEEVGEVARILSRTHGEQSSKAGEQPLALSDELADVLFVVICLANQSHIDLQSASKPTFKRKPIETRPGIAKTPNYKIRGKSRLLTLRPRSIIPEE